MWSLICTCILCIVAWPSLAYAWGPGMHLEIALDCLDKLPLAAPVIAKLLKRYPNEFLYGAVSPDIFLSKMRAGLLFHCHNWRMGHLLLSEAKTERLRACVYGYLVHLAADVVAHNYFVPYKIIRSYNARMVSPHTYWEMRFDLTVANTTWDVIPKVTQGKYHDFDALLERVLKKTLFSFKTSQRIFKSLLVVHKLKQLRGGLRQYAKKSRMTLDDTRVHYFRELIDASVNGFLENPEKAQCLKGDPTGHPREMEATRLRKRMRQAIRRKQLSRQDAEKLVALCDRRLHQGIYQRDMAWPDIFDVM